MTPDMAQYMGVFLDEGHEQLGLLESNILALERGDHSSEMLQVLFRAAHTLKGSSRAMGFLAIGDLTHEMENVLDDLRNDKLAVSTPIVNALLACLDALAALLEMVSETGADTGVTDKDIPALVSRLSALRQGVEDAPAPVPVASPQIAVPLELSEHEQASLNDAALSGLAPFHISVTLAADCVMKSVRVFMILTALEPLGSILASTPDEDALDAEDFDDQFQLLLVTDSEPAQIEAVLATIAQLASVTVRPWMVGSPLTPNSGGTREDHPAPLELVSGGDLGTGGTAKPTPIAPAHTQTIRVDVTRLDNLLNLVGELVIDRTQIARLVGDLQARYPQDEDTVHLLEAIHRIARITGELQDQIMKTRMLPIDGVFQRMPRMVRDLAQKTGKEVEFLMEGGETELDRSVLEALGDPLIHLLRNSVDHGIETPEDRAAAGKPTQGRVILAASQEENHIIVVLSDDGGGIDPIKIKAAAVNKGVITQAAADAMTDKDAIGLIFASGFSTAAVLSDISGRGVGMDIVKSNLEKLGGRLHVDSKVGVGSRFTIHLPLTLAIVRALLVAAGGGTYVLPLASVVEMLRLGSGEGEVPRKTVNGQAVMVLRGRTVPLASLASVLCGDINATHANQIPDDAYVVVIGFGETQVGLCVDALVGEQEVVIKSLGTLLGDIAGLAGATILGNGQVALIVDVAKAIEGMREKAMSPTALVLTG
jgi:two-component system chemotaxis sensor kinase CheA